MPIAELERPLLDRARRGDRAAFRALYERYADPLYGFLFRMLPERAAAEDALQDVFLRVHRALPTFDPDGPARLSTWLFAIARNVAITRARGRTPPPDDAPPSTVPPDRSLELADVRAALTVAIEALPLPQRSVFILRELCHLGYDDIAAVEEIDLNTVRSRLHRARAALQDALRRALPDEVPTTGALGPAPARAARGGTP